MVCFQCFSEGGINSKVFTALGQKFKCGESLVAAHFRFPGRPTTNAVPLTLSNNLLKNKRKSAVSMALLGRVVEPTNYSKL